MNKVPLAVLTFGVTFANPAIPKPIIQTQSPHQAVTTPAAADLDGDGINELVMQFTRGEHQEEGVYAYSWCGEYLFRLARTSSSNAYGFPPVTVANLDDNPDDEEILVRDRNGLRAIDGDGTVLWHLQHEDFDRFNSAPIIAHDFDGDGIDEVVYTTPFANESTKLIMAGRWSVPMDRDNFGVGAHIVLLLGEKIVAISKPGAEQSPHIIRVFNQDGTDAGSWRFRAADAVAVGNDLIALEYPFIQDGEIMTSIAKAGGERTEITIGPDYFKEWYDADGTRRWKYTRGFVSRIPDALMVDGDTIYFTTNLFLYEAEVGPKNGYRVTVKRQQTALHAVTIKNLSVTSKLIDSPTPVQPAPPTLSRPVFLEERKTFYTKTFRARGEDVTVETSLERQGARWYRVTDYQQSAILTDGQGTWDLFVPMIGGELHRIRMKGAPAWAEYRGNNRRTGASDE